MPGGSWRCASRERGRFRPPSSWVPEGPLTGRLVDDRGLPLSGYILKARKDHGAPGFAQSRHPVWEEAVRTGKDGRFEVPHLAARPSGVHLIENETDVVSWLKCELGLFASGYPEEPIKLHLFELTGDETQDLGDIVIERGVTYAGRLLEEDGRPVIGALATTRSRIFTNGLNRVFGNAPRSIDPWQEPIDFRPDECRTDGSGRFLLRLRDRAADPRPRVSGLYVWTRDGRKANFDLPAAKPGEAVQDLEFRLGDDYVFEIELTDEAGKPTRPWGEDGVPTGLVSYRGENVRFFPERIPIDVVFRGEQASWSNAVGPDPDGKVRFQIDSSRGVPAGLHLSVPGFEQVDDFFPEDPPHRIVRRYALKPFSRIVLEARLFGALDRLDVRKDHICFQACPESPETKRAAGVLDDHWKSGLGSISRFRPDDDLTRVVLPVRTRDPCWIYVRLESKTAHMPTRFFGPFEPSETLRSIRIEILSGAGDGEPGATPRAAAEAKGPPVHRGRGRVTLTLIDGNTGEPLKGARLQLESRETGKDRKPPRRAFREGGAGGRRKGPSRTLRLPRQLRRLPDRGAR